MRLGARIQFETRVEALLGSTLNLLDLRDNRARSLADWLLARTSGRHPSLRSPTQVPRLWQRRGLNAENVG